jgi:UDP-3-O-[3-hydroxymyristoyl] glucosamine N-acyltransferase
MAYSVSELARHLGLLHQGNGDRQVTKVSGWKNADDCSLVFLQSASKDKDSVRDLAAACVIAPRSCIQSGWNAIVSDTPKLDFARAAGLLYPRAIGKGFRHATATISPEATIGSNVDIGPYVTVQAGAHIGKESVLHPGVVIGERCVVGEQCVLHSRVVLYPEARLEDRVVLHAGVVVGSDGFGYVLDASTQVKFPQVGNVLIEADVEIGAGTTIDRGSLGTTQIGEGSKIDNLVQIAHNVRIGRSVVIAAQTGVAGSTVIEDYAIIGGQVGFGDHARVEKGVIIGSKAGVLPGKIVRSGDVYWGVPVRPLREFKRLNALFGRLPAFKKELESLREGLVQVTEKIRELQDRK